MSPPAKDMFFNEFSTSPKGECRKISAALNSKIGNRSSSAPAGVRGSELIAGNESGIPLTQIFPGVESVCGSNAMESVALDGAICSRSKAVAVNIYSSSKAVAATGTISWM